MSCSALPTSSVAALMADPRIERLKQVRQQAMNLSKSATLRYRSYIEREKVERENSKKIANKKLAEESREVLYKSLKLGLSSHGEGHRQAHIATMDLIDRVKNSDMENCENAKASWLRGKDAMKKQHVEDETNSRSRQERPRRVFETKRATAIDNRENLKDFLESQRAKAAADQLAEEASRLWITRTQDRVDKFSTSIFNRGMAPVHATVTRHGVTGPLKSSFGRSRSDNSHTNDSAEVTTIKCAREYKVENTFTEELGAAARRIFKNVLLQLKSISVAKTRAKEARHVELVKTLTRTFEDDLALLYNVDRNGARAKRVKNVDTIPKDKKDIQLSQNFEMMFKSYQQQGFMNDISSGSISQSSEASSVDNKDERSSGDGRVPLGAIVSVSALSHPELSALSFEPPMLTIVSDSNSETSAQMISTASSYNSSSDSTAPARHDHHLAGFLESTAPYSVEPNFSLSELEQSSPKSPLAAVGVRNKKVHSTLRKAELQKYNDVVAHSVEGGSLFIPQSGKKLQEASLEDFNGNKSSDSARQTLTLSDSLESYDMLPNIVNVFSRIVDQKDSFLSSNSMKSSITNTEDLNNSSMLSSVDIELKYVHIDGGTVSTDQSFEANVLENHSMDAKSRYQALLASDSMSSSVDRSSDDAYLRDIKMRVTRIESVIAREQQRDILGSEVFRSSTSSSASASAYGRGAGDTNTSMGEADADACESSSEPI